MARKRNRFLMEELEEHTEHTLEENEDSWVSRSQKKRNSTALQKLGEDLVSIGPGSLKKIPLNDDLQEALKLVAKITDHEGRRRQMQYIGKLMRDVDVAPIQEALDAIKQGHGKQTATLHHAERLRERLLTASAAEVDTLLEPWPQHAANIKELLVKAKNETSPQAKRALFRALHKLL